jgi:hypothetical protein
VTLSAAVLARLRHLAPEHQIDAIARHLGGGEAGPLADLPVGSELSPSPNRIDGRALELVCDRALAGARGALFTPAPEARILSVLGLAHAAARRGGPPPEGAAPMLLGLAPASAELTSALEGLAVLDPACGGGALLAAAEMVARRCGARLRLHAIDLSPLAIRATLARLALLGADSRCQEGDALTLAWPQADLVLANPPYLRHERLSPKEKRRARARSGLPLQADLSAHFALAALRSASTCALVLPEKLFSARSAQPLLAEARERGGFALRLRSRTAGSFAASVETSLAIWIRDGKGSLDLEAKAPLAELSDAEIATAAAGRPCGRLRAPARRTAPSGSRPLSDFCAVRFGMKSGCNAFFHLLPRHPPAASRDPRSRSPSSFLSPLLGPITLDPGDTAPLLRSLKEARAPALLEPSAFLFRPAGSPGAAARRYIGLGEELGVHRRPTCAGREPWWAIAPGREPAPLLYPAKVGARAFAVLNEGALLEDKKWHALFPLASWEGDPWMLAAALSSTPVRLAIDAAARQLTGAQAIADVDCRVLAAAPIPPASALAAHGRTLRDCWAELARDPVTTDLRAMLARPAQRTLDAMVAGALGFGSRAAERARAELLERVAVRLERAARIRAVTGRRDEL